MSFVLLLPLLLSAQPAVTGDYLPALPAIAQILGSISTSLTVFALAFDIGQFPMGSLADRFGRRQMPLIGLACYALAALAGASATATSMLTAVRALQGFSTATILACIHATVHDLHPVHGDPHVMARGLTGFGFMALMAPALGTFVVQHVSRRWALVGMNFYAIVLWAVCWYSFAEARHETPTQAGSIRTIFSSASSCTWDLLAVTTYVGIFCSSLLLPMIYTTYLDLSPGFYDRIPTGGPFVYILSMTGYRRPLRRQSLVRTIQQGATLSVAGACIRALDCWLLPEHA